jgi:hypothetical protein
MTDQLARLSEIRLRTEADVREEFVTPLLRLLGYDHARDEIQRGANLTTPFKSGTKRKEYIVPDYLIKLDALICFALDAKAPGQTQERAKQLVLDPKHVAQVYSYAAHREVQAPLFVVSNGQYTAVFETASTSLDPILIVAQPDLQAQFSELEARLSRRCMHQFLADRLPVAWIASVRYRAAGDQPMNIDIGDVNLDGDPEIVVALSENRIPIFSARGDHIASIDTDGWTWWVKCTGATDPNEATLVAIQHQRAGKGPAGRLLGIRGSSVIWVHDLSRAGSGFEDFERVITDPKQRTVIFGVAVDNIVSCLSWTGQKRWETRITGEMKWQSVMHVTQSQCGTVLVTSGGQHTGVLAELDPITGNILHAMELPFRGAQIAALDPVHNRLVVTDADSASIVFADLESDRLSSIITTAMGVSHPRIAANHTLGLLALAGIGRLDCYPIAALHDRLPEPFWTSRQVFGLINRLAWVETPRGHRLLLSTCGSAGQPQPNGMFVLTPEGAVEQKYYLSSSPASGRPTGVRAIKAATGFTRADSMDIVAVADDSRLYVWQLP